MHLMGPEECGDVLKVSVQLRDCIVFWVFGGALVEAHGQVNCRQRSDQLGLLCHIARLDAEATLCGATLDAEATLSGTGTG